MKPTGQTHTVTVAERRTSLLTWLQECPRHTDGMSTTEIVDIHGQGSLYSGHGRYDRCFDDLQALAHDGYVERTGRPARWYVR